MGMTNGEKLCFDFPDVTTRTFQNEGFIYITVERDDEWVADFDTAWWYAEYKEPTTKNDLAQERYQDLIEYFGGEDIITDIVLTDKNMFKAWLDRVRWYIKRADELAKELEQLKSTIKNDLSVDCISRTQAQTEIEMNASRYTIAKERGGMGQVEWSDHLIEVSDAVDIIRNLPSVTPQEPKPMVEIDLYSVIKQKYIEREVLDKIKEQIKSHLRGVEITLEVLVENDPLRPKMEGAKDTLEECMEIIDKAESENT